MTRLLDFLNREYSCLLCVIGRRPKEDNFGSNRDKREKDFFSFSFSPLSCGWSNEGFDHSFSRTLSQLGSAPKRRGSCHTPGVSYGTTVRYSVMEVDHVKSSSKFREYSCLLFFGLFIINRESES
jgi:hypothetical protein